jgi:hypothetical protein
LHDEAFVTQDEGGSGRARAFAKQKVEARLKFPLLASVLLLAVTACFGPQWDQVIENS